MSQAHVQPQTEGNSMVPKPQGAQSASGAPRLYGCSSVDLYGLSAKLGEGTFGQVHQGVFKPTGTAVALKEIIVHERDEGIPITALREIKIMKVLRHANVLHLLDMAVSRARSERDNGRDPKVRPLSTYYMVMAYMDHDLCGLLHNKEIRFRLPQIKLYMQQLLAGVGYLHDMNYMHRDMKSANILVSNDGTVKVADFGLARKYHEAPPDLTSATPAAHKYTPKVVTRWYRPPELLLGEQYYTTAIDVWGIGCIFGEFFKRRVVLPGQSDHDQIMLIFKLMGSPTPETMPTFAQLPVAREIMPLPEMPCVLNDVFSNVPADARGLLAGLLTLNPQRRFTAKGALQHAFFSNQPPPARPEELPTFPSSRELDVRRKREAPSPLAGGAAPPPPAKRLRAFAPKVPGKKILTGIDLVPPYRRIDALRKMDTGSNPNNGKPSNGNGADNGGGDEMHGSGYGRQRESRATGTNGASGPKVMSNGLDY